RRRARSPRRGRADGDPPFRSTPRLRRARPPAARAAPRNGRSSDRARAGPSAAPRARAPPRARRSTAPRAGSPAWVPVSRFGWRLHRVGVLEPLRPALAAPTRGVEVGLLDLEGDRADADLDVV